jgi:phosphatidylglycerophosphate synthase
LYYNIGDFGGDYMFKRHIETYKKEIKQGFEDLKHKETFYKQIPNLLTFIRLVFAIPAGLLSYLNPVASLILVGLLWLTDAVDGKIARKFDIQSKLGADMDTIADKLMFLGSSIPLFSVSPLLITSFVLEGVISLINVIGRLNGLDTKTVMSGKVKTVSLGVSLVIGYLSKFLGVPSVVFKSLIGLTTILQTVAIKDYLVAYNNMDIDKNKNVVIPNVPDDIASDELDDKDQNSMVEELMKEREFLLATLEPDKVYTGKKRARTMLQDKKNNH